MTSLKCKFISPSNRKYTDCVVEVIKLVFKVQKQSFADVTFSRTPLVAASENLRNAFAQKKFSLQLKLSSSYLFSFLFFCCCHDKNVLEYLF